MSTASEIIDLLGGTNAVATALGLAPTTVSSWRPVNFIPRWWHAELLALAMRSEKPLATTDFPSAEQRVPRPRKEAA